MGFANFAITVGHVGALWRRADFRNLWAAQTISQIGSQVTLLALPLSALKVLHASAFQVGLLGTAEYAPFVIVSLPAGVWVDRLQRRPLLISCDLGRALVLGSIPLAYVFGLLTLAYLYVAAFAAGALTVLFDVAYQSYLPVLVQLERLVEANTKLELSRSGAQLAGPGFAGLLIQALSAPAAILVDAGSFVGSALFLALIRRTEEQPHHLNRGLAALVRDMILGLRHVMSGRLLRPIAVATAISNLFTQTLYVALLVYMVERLRLPSRTIGLTLTLGSCGFLVGALVSGWFAVRLGPGRTIMLAISCNAGLLLVPLAPRDLAVPFIAAGWSIASFGGVVYNVHQVSLRQAIIPPGLLGRTNASIRFMVWGTIPLGSLLGGVLASHLGLQTALWVGAAGSLAAILPLTVSPVPRVRIVEAANATMSGEATPPQPIAKTRKGGH